MKRRKRRQLPRVNMVDIAVRGEDDIRASLPDALLPHLWEDMKGDVRGVRSSLVFRHPRLMNEVVRLGTAPTCPCCNRNFRSGGPRMAILFNPATSLKLLRSDSAVKAVETAVTFEEMQDFCRLTWESVRGDGCTEIYECDHFCGHALTHEMNDFVGGIGAVGEVQLMARATGRVGFVCQKRLKMSTKDAEDTLVKRVHRNFESVQTGRRGHGKRRQACS